MCTFQKAIKNVEVAVDIQKGTQGLEILFLTIDVLVSSNSYFHPLLSYGNCLR